MARIPLVSAVIDAVPVAPAVMIFGPGRERGLRLTQLLSYLCRHPLLLTGVNTAGFRGIPSGARFTHIIRQPKLTDKMYELLYSARHRDLAIPSGGKLLDLFGAQIIHTEDAPDAQWARGALQVWMGPDEAQLPAFHAALEGRVAELLNMLLNFRNENLNAASWLQVNTSLVCPPLRDLARALCTATPDDEGLREEVFELLRDQDNELRNERWVSLDTVAVEAILVADFETPDGKPCVAQLAAFAQEILGRRGCTKLVDDAVLGKHLKMLGFNTERDSQCARLHLTSRVVDRAKLLAVQFGVQLANERPV